MNRPADLKESTEETITRLKEVAHSGVRDLERYAEDLETSLRLKAATLPRLEANGLELLAEAAAVVALPLELGGSQGPVSYIEMRIGYNGMQAQLARPLEVGRYTAVVLVLRDQVEEPR